MRYMSAKMADYLLDMNNTPVQIYTYTKNNFLWTKNSKNSIPVEVSAVITDGRDAFVFPDHDKKMLSIGLSSKIPGGLFSRRGPKTFECALERVVRKSVLGYFDKMEMATETVNVDSDKVRHTWRRLTIDDLTFHNTKKAMLMTIDKSVIYIYFIVEIEGRLPVRFTPTDFYLIDAKTALVNAVKNGVMLPNKKEIYKFDSPSIILSLLVMYGDIRFPTRGESGW